MNFASDNVAGTSPALLQALADINDRPLPSYGGDPYTDEVEALCREIFEHDSLRTPALEEFPVQKLALELPVRLAKQGGEDADAVELAGRTHPE